ncbi:MAG: sugar phosphate nucleotidyltransferase [bacterium]
MKAVILAGGKGTRLKPYTTVIPKALVPIGEQAILEILLKQLKRYNVTDVTICLNHFAEIIQAYFGNGEKLGITISYSIEDQPLGTVAPIKLIDHLPQDFLVMNGDLLTDLNFTELFLHHQQHKSLLTVSSYQRKSRIDFGVLEVDPESQIVSGFREKPELDFIVSMGVYAMNRKVLDFVPDGPFGFDELILTLLSHNQRLKVFPFAGYWLDIGRPDDYEKANEDMKTNPNLFS